MHHKHKLKQHKCNIRVQDEAVLLDDNIATCSEAAKAAAELLVISHDKVDELEGKAKEKVETTRDVQG